MSKFWKWYDKWDDLWKLITGLILIVALIVAGHEKGIAGYLYLIFFVLLLGSRIFYKTSCQLKGIKKGEEEF